jgi:hypothetical protein
MYLTMLEMNLFDYHVDILMFVDILLRICELVNRYRLKLYVILY